MINLLHVGLCSYVNALVDDYQQYILRVDQHIGQIDARGDNVPRAQQMRSFFIDLVQFHIKIIRIMDNMKASLDESLCVQLILFVVFLALSLFCMDQHLDEMNLNAILSLNCLISQTMYNTLFSFFSDKVRTRSVDIARYAYDTRWYELPLKQRIFIAWIVRRAQKPLVITGGRIIPSSIETIAKAWEKHFVY